MEQLPDLIRKGQQPDLREVTKVCGGDTASIRFRVIVQGRSPNVQTFEHHS